MVYRITAPNTHIHKHIYVDIPLVFTKKPFYIYIPHQQEFSNRFKIYKHIYSTTTTSKLKPSEYFQKA